MDELLDRQWHEKNAYPLKVFQKGDTRETTEKAFGTLALPGNTPLFLLRLLSLERG